VANRSEALRQRASACLVLIYRTRSRGLFQYFARCILALNSLDSLSVPTSFAVLPLHSPEAGETDIFVLVLDSGDGSELCYYQVFQYVSIQYIPCAPTIVHTQGYRLFCFLVFCFRDLSPGKPAVELVHVYSRMDAVTPADLLFRELVLLSSIWPQHRLGFFEPNVMVVFLIPSRLTRECPSHPENARSLAQ